MKKTIKLLTVLLLLVSFVLAMPVAAFATNEHDEQMLNSTNKGFRTFSPMQYRQQRIEAFKEHIEEERAKFADMNEDQLTSYIDEKISYAKALDEINTRDDEFGIIEQLIRLNLKLAALATAQLVKLVGLPCTGILIEYSVFGKNYEETDGIFAWKIKRTDAYKDYSSGSLSFDLTDDIDLFFSIHGTHSVANIDGKVVITDIYDFDQTNFTGIAAILNKVGAVMQEYQVLEEISVTIKISK